MDTIVPPYPMQRLLWWCKTWNTWHTYKFIFTFWCRCMAYLHHECLKLIFKCKAIILYLMYVRWNLTSVHSYAAFDHNPQLIDYLQCLRYRRHNSRLIAINYWYVPPFRVARMWIDYKNTHKFIFHIQSNDFIKECCIDAFIVAARHPSRSNRFHNTHSKPQHHSPWPWYSK